MQLTMYLFWNIASLSYTVIWDGIPPFSRGGFWVIVSMRCRFYLMHQQVYLVFQAWGFQNESRNTWLIAKETISQAISPNSNFE